MLKTKLFKIPSISAVSLAALLLVALVLFTAIIYYFETKSTSPKEKPKAVNSISRKKELIATPQLNRKNLSKKTSSPQVSPKKDLAEPLVPVELIPYTKINGVDLRRGTIKFRITFNWSQRDKILAWVNFNGKDKRQIMEIWFGERFFAFDTYSNDEEEGEDDPNVEFTDPFGKTYDIKVTWNFIDKPYTKRIYVDNMLKKETHPEFVPSKIEGQFLINKDLENLSVSKNWEN